MKGGPINSVVTDEQNFQDMIEYFAEPSDIPSSSSSSSSLVGEKKHGAVILYRYGNHSLKIPNNELIQPEAYSIEKWRLKFEDLKLRNERHIENIKLREKMADLREKMQKVALDKEKKIEPFLTSSASLRADAALRLPSMTHSKNCVQLRSKNFKSGPLAQMGPRKCSAKTGESVKKGLVSLHPEYLHNDVKTPQINSLSRNIEDLQNQGSNSSNMSISSSSKTNIEATVVDGDFDNIGKCGGDVVGQTTVEMLRQIEKKACATSGFLPLQMREPSDLFLVREYNNDTPNKEPAIYDGNDFFPKNHIMPEIAGGTTINSNRKPPENNNLPFKDDDSNLASFSKNNLQFLDCTFQGFRNREMRMERMKEEPKEDKKNKTLVVNFCDLDRGIKDEEGDDNNRYKTDDKMQKLAYDVRGNDSHNLNQDYCYQIPKLESKHNFDSGNMPSQISLSSADRVTKCPINRSTLKFKSPIPENRSRHGFLPPIKSKNPQTINQPSVRSLTKVSSPKLMARKDSFTIPCMKKKTNKCHNDIDNFCSRNHTSWKEQQILWYASEEEDEENISEMYDENMGIEEDFPTLEIPGSLLGSDLDGYKVRVKKLVESKKMNLKILQVPDWENTSKSVCKRTGYIISTSHFPHGLDAECSASFPKQHETLFPDFTDKSASTKPILKKKCDVCHKKTTLAASFICRCGQNFCSSHRYPEAHCCTFDYKLEGRKALQERNPVVNAPKLPKI